MQPKIQGELLDEWFEGCGSPLRLENVVRVTKESQILLISLLIKQKKPQEIVVHCYGDLWDPSIPLREC